jgi:periplasmic divalent cation tolerance protein
MTSESDVCEVIITAPDAEWLVAFSRRLIEDRLAAAGHHFAPIRSIYRWRERIEDVTEARVALHTRPTLVPSVIDRVNREHPYEVPCVIAVPMTSGNPAYIRWVLDATSAIPNRLEADTSCTTDQMTGE